MTQNVNTVRQVNAYIKNMFTQDYMLNRIYVKGEVSNCKYHTSGHIYFSLKDESGTIACVMFAGQRGGLAFHMREGQQVVVFGGISVYERFQALKQELGEMGMFAPEYKKTIPSFVKTVGIVTAPTGAAIRDIMNISSRRNPFVQLILYPALVQGEGAVQSIVTGIQTLDAYGVDVMIVGRGGGSIEDLWAFNEEAVARAIFECETPVISAVGHETDTTIADYVADLRAPTPSAAAELAVYDYRLTERTMIEYREKATRLLEQQIRMQRLRLREYQTKLMYLHPENQVRDYRQRIVDYEEKLRLLMENSLQKNKMRFTVDLEKMKKLSPLEKLNQGFSYVETADRKAVKRIGQVDVGDELTIYVTDGTIKVCAEETKEERHG